MEPGKTRVMEPLLAHEVRNQKEMVYQVKWDGVRMLSFVSAGQVVLQNRRGRIKTETFPELKSLATVFPQPFILDGEVVALKDGRPDFSLVLKRNFTSSPSPGAPPVSYIVFDILLWQGRDVRDKPLHQRQENLAMLEVPPGPVSVIDNFLDGEKLLQLTSQRGWEGIVYKDVRSPYVAGKSPYWHKVKNKQLGIFDVVGYITKQGQLASLITAKDFGDGLVLTGSVGSGLSNKGRKLLRELLTSLSQNQPPLPVKRTQNNWNWVRPVLKAEVEFFEWTEALTLRAPVFKGLMLEGKKFELP